MQEKPVCVVPVKSGTEMGSERLDELLTISGTETLFIAAIGDDGTIIYLRVSSDIDEKPLEELALQEVSAHKRRRKGLSSSAPHPH